MWRRILRHCSFVKSPKVRLKLLAQLLPFNFIRLRRTAELRLEFLKQRLLINKSQPTVSHDKFAVDQNCIYVYAPSPMDDGINDGSVRIKVWLFNIPQVYQRHVGSFPRLKRTDTVTKPASMSAVNCSHMKYLICRRRSVVYPRHSV